MHTPTDAHTPDAQAAHPETLWLSQGDAARRLCEEGDTVSRSALVRYLANHAEVPTKSEGPGKPVYVDFAALKASRSRAAVRKPDPVAPAPSPAEPAASSFVPKTPEFVERQRQAQLDRDEQAARLARLKADEAEGKIIRRDEAIAAFRSIAAILVQGFEARRRKIVGRIRAATDTRGAEIAMRDEEADLRRLVVAEISKLLPEAPAPAAVEAAE